MNRRYLPFLVASAAIVLTANYATNAETARDTKPAAKAEADVFASVVKESGGLPNGLKELRLDLGLLETIIDRLHAARNQVRDSEAKFEHGTESADMLRDARDRLLSAELSYRELISDMNAKYQK